MTRTTFSDADEFADALNGVSGRYVPTRRAATDWWVETMNLGPVGMQRVQIGGGATFAGSGEPGMLSIGLPDTEPRELRIDGHSFEPHSMLVLHGARSFTSSSANLVRWTGIHVPLDYDGLQDGVQEAALALDGVQTHTELPRIASLRAFVTSVCDRADEGAFEDPAAVRAAASQAISCLTRVLESSAPLSERHVGRPQFSRARVIGRALELIEGSEGQPLFIDDLCRVTQVSERTLRNIFQEYFGVGPMRLLKVRQLREIRAALLAADPTHDTVTRVASRFGVWDFSLFARNYKALYSESPSETLRRLIRPAERRRDLSWVECATRIFVDETLTMPVPDMEAGDMAG
jgi:AraC family transcriptional regulator, ethanolamine operon transcriptional activator